MQNLVLYVATVLIWGSTWYAITWQIDAADARVSLFLRFGLAGVLLLGFCRLRGIRLAFEARDHLAMAAQGGLLFSVNYLLFYWCTAWITSGLVAVIFSTVILMNIVNGALFLGRPIQPRVLIGGLFGLAGISLVFLPELGASGEAGADALRGLLVGLVATYCASLGNILSMRNQRVGIPVLQGNAWGMLYGALLMLLLVMVSGAPLAIDWSLGYGVSLLYLALFGSILAFGAYLTLVGRIGADRAAYASILFPLVALAISSLLEDYHWHSEALLGVMLIVVGNVLVLGRGLFDRGVRQGAASADATVS